MNFTFLLRLFSTEQLISLQGDSYTFRLKRKEPKVSQKRLFVYEMNRNETDNSAFGMSTKINKCKKLVKLEEK